MLMAKIIASPQITIAGHHDPGLTLDRFHQEAYYIGIFQGLGQGIHLIIGYLYKSGRIRAEIGVGTRIGAHGDNRDRTSVEILATNHDLRTLRSDPFPTVSPTAAKLQSRLYRLGPRIHRQELIISEKLTGKFHVLTQYIRMKSTGYERKLLRLLHQGLHDLRMAMSLAQGRIARQEIKITFSFQVPHEHAFASSENDRQRMVVVGTILLLSGNVIFRFHTIIEFK